MWFTDAVGDYFDYVPHMSRGFLNKRLKMSLFRNLAFVLLFLLVLVILALKHAKKFQPSNAVCTFLMLVAGTLGCINTNEEISL